MVIFLLAVLALAALNAKQTVDNCPVLLPRDEYLKVHGNSCFEFAVFRVRSYSDASTDCRNHGGTLALVKSQNISDFLVDQLLFEYGHGTKVWIGLTDIETEGTFLWDDGTPLDYTNWAHGHGGNLSHTNEDCVTIQASQDGRWDDDICEDGLFGFVLHRFPYICEFKLRGH